MDQAKDGKQSGLLPSGIEGLDTILKGGFVPGSAYIINGPPGAGKTILSNQFCFNQARLGRKALYVSLLAESHDRMLNHMRSLSFYAADYVPDSLFYVSAFDVLQSEGLDGLLRLINAEIRSHGADVAVLDGLFVAHDNARDEQDFRRFVHELQGQAAMTGCTMLLLTNQARAASAPEHTMVDGWIELLDEMHRARAVRTLVMRKHRGGHYLRGRHQFRITDAGIKVFPRIEAVLSHEPADSGSTERVSTGIHQLDGMMGGGYPMASTTLLLGPTGVGKTTIGLQFLSGCTPEEPGLLFGFYETPARIRTKARSIGIDLDGLIERGAVTIVWQSPAENLPDEVGHRLLDAVGRCGARRVFVDGIGAWKEAFLYPERLPVFLNTINNTLKGRNATVVYTMEVRELFFPDRLRTDDLSAMIDNVLLLHYDLSDDAIQRKLSILKIRDSSFDGFSEVFHVSDKGVRFGEDPSQRGRPVGGPRKPGPSKVRSGQRSRSRRRGEGS